MKRNFFTFYELVAVICVLAVLFTLLPTVLATSAQEAKLKACTDNLKQLGYAVEMYRYDNDERFMMPAYRPPKGFTGCEISWDTLLACPKLGNYVKPFHMNCPEMPIYLPERWKDPKQYAVPSNWMWASPGYGYNAMWAGGTRRGGGYYESEPYTIASVEEPANLLLIADSADPKRQYGGRFLWPNYTTAETVLWPRHNGAVNVLYADGHAKSTHSGSTECNEQSAQKLYDKGAELECSATCNRVKCKWRCDLD